MTETLPTEGWAVLRQAVIATADHDATSSRLREGLGLEPGFADPLLADIGLRDETLRIGSESHLEVVAPLTDDHPLRRWLAKVGGTAGYCLSVQVPDVQVLLDSAAAAGVRVLFDERHFDRRIVQLHPGDMGVIVELDEIPERDVWFWDDVDAVEPASPLVGDVLGVEIATPDPAALAQRWTEVLGAVLADDQSAYDDGAARVWLGTRRVRFVEGPQTVMRAVELAASEHADGAPSVVDLDGVELRINRP
ncbi:hypothetical protein [Nocardioides flavescens]|uniref:VOC domain-containing protein n=1 Tax=Nocardioides flavescens TaxID=2691959 RepID=A0A6L7F478_9ACTN|nr:hypothetical protein [Nocardioides flavescens]MXG92035.1 hypothetical protein [Nocardioides flavescens]